MSKFDHTQLSRKDRQELITPLAQALTHIKKPEEMREFLSRLLSPSELVMISRRFKIAEQLVEGATYHSIREKMGVGFSTIQTVEKWLAHSVRDYEEIRAKERREQAQKEKHENRLKSLPRLRGPRSLLTDLLRSY